MGEYTALACVTGFSSSRRCSRWCSTGVARCTNSYPGRTGTVELRLAAIRPSQIDLDHDHVTAFVAEIAERTGEFLQIVNYNLRGSQYAIAGTARSGRAGGRGRTPARNLRRQKGHIQVPGIDVPFHSSVLRNGVAEFRAHWTESCPPAIVGSPAATSPTWCRGCSPWTATSSPRSGHWCRRTLGRDPADYDAWITQRPREVGRRRSSNLAWQFASPVRWIETQDLLFTEEAAGGLGWSDSSRSA